MTETYTVFSPGKIHVEESLKMSLRELVVNMCPMVALQSKKTPRQVALFLVICSCRITVKADRKQEVTII